MRRAILCSIVCLTACSYDVVELALDEVQPGDGGDDASVGGDGQLGDGALGDEALGDVDPGDGSLGDVDPLTDLDPADGGTDVDPGDSATGDADPGVVDEPPVPVINGGAAPVVPLNQEAWLDGSGSYDPEGAALTYLWSLSSNCLGSFTSAPEGEVVKVTLTQLSSDCRVTLSVSDGTNTASVSVLVTIVEHGTYVDRGAGACSDEPSAPFSGTPGKPFCTVTAGLAAADALNATTVFVQSGSYSSEPGALVVPNGVMVRGSLDGAWAGPADWSGRSPDTSIQVSPPGVSFTPGPRRSGLDGVSVSAKTGGDWAALVRVAEADVLLDHVSLEGPAVADTDTSTIRVVAGAAPARLSFRGTAVGPSGAADGYVVHVTALGGNVANVTLSGKLVASEASKLAAGVRSLGDVELKLLDLTVDVTAAVTAPLGYALLDGATSSPTLTPDTQCVGSFTCDGASLIDIGRSNLNVDAFAQSTAAGLFGSTNVTFNQVTVDADAAGVVTGLHTQNTSVVNGGLTAIAHLANGGTGRRRAIAWLDGDDETSALTRGSTNLTLRPLVLRATTDSEGGEELGGARLIGSTHVEAAVDVAVYPASGSPSVARTYGAWSTGVQSLTVEPGGSLSLSELAVSDWGAAFADGPGGTSNDDVASDQVTVQGATLSATLGEGADALPLRGISLTNSTRSRVADNNIRCGPMGSLRAIELVALRATSEVQIEANVLRLLGSVSTEATGIRDGTPSTVAAAQVDASIGLMVLRNDIRLASSGTPLLRGVALRAGIEKVVVVNNAIHMMSQARAVGVQTVGRPLELHHNTMRLGGINTAGAFAVGLHAGDVGTGGLDVSRNIFDPLSGTAARYSNLLFGVSTMPTQSWFARLDENLHSTDTIFQATSSSTLPPTGSTTLTGFDTSNTKGVASYCGDGIHLASRTALPNITTQRTATDIDGSVRADLGPLVEAGADEIPDSASVCF